MNQNLLLVVTASIGVVIIGALTALGAEKVITGTECLTAITGIVSLLLGGLLTLLKSDAISPASEPPAVPPTPTAHVA